MYERFATVGVVIPTLNEEKVIGRNLAALLLDPQIQQIVVVDGGSTDCTQKIVTDMIQSELDPQKLRWQSSVSGRGCQMNAGAQLLTTEWIVFHHADSLLPKQAGRCVSDLPETISWGGISHQFHPGNWKLDFISALHSYRCRRSGVVYGDQSMFVRKTFFDALDGFNESELEDLKFSDHALTSCPSHLLPQRVKTESRKFRQIGEFRALAQTISIILRYERKRHVGHEKFFENFR